VLAKGLAAGYAPLAAALVPAALVEELSATTGFVVSHSYDASPIACAAGAAVLDEIVERDLIANAERVGAELRAGLEVIAENSPLIGDVRAEDCFSRSNSSPTGPPLRGFQPRSIPVRLSSATASTMGFFSTRVARTEGASATGS